VADVDGPDFDSKSREVVGPEESNGLDELTDEERHALDDADVTAYDRVPEDEGNDDEFDLLPAFLAWVEAHLSVVECTQSDKSTAAWCPEWWKHPEAVERLWACFEARQQVTLDAAARMDALSDWWLTHWDRHAAILFDSKAGPFRKCDRNLGHLHDSNGTEEQRVPYYAPPTDWRR
jgi:hypothetical protein